MSSATLPADPLTLRHPPLDEFVIGVQFRGDASDDAVALADFWPRIRADFPALEKQPPLPPISEEFGAPSPTETNIQLLTSPPPPRYWFISEDENRLIQLQPDRLLLNWRKRRPDDQYPRYRILREEFRARYSDLLAALPPARQPEAVPSWCELTYINHVEAAGAAGRTHRPLSHILRLVSAPRLTAVGPPEDTQLQQRHVVRDDDRGPIGRLYITAAPALRSSDRSPIYVLTLLARLQPAERSVEAVMAALDRARTLLVDTFKEITTPRMHSLWGIEEPDA
jgi:uncharacterized protein (TIGR04255 family)